VTRRTRTLRYGTAVAVALVGVACGVLIPGTAGGTAATVLVGIGLVGVVSLLFYEVGLTEDRDRERSRRPSDLGDAAHPPRTGAAPHEQPPTRRAKPDWLKERRRRSH
jgi:hypothetical protein